VRSVETEYGEWTALSNLDVRAHIEANFTCVEDWQNNFSMIKQKRIELKKLNDSRKIDCINVNIVPFKDGVEDLLKKMSDALVETL